MTVGQGMFSAAVLDPTRPVPDGLTDGDARPAGRRFNVFRNNVAVSLTEAMRTGFPVITRLLGQENMDGLAGLFLRRHPPQSPLMMHYGAAFPDFLAGMEQLAHLGYLPDVARLELALRRSYHAADAAGIDPGILAQIAPETLINQTVTLAPAVQMVRSNWPIFDIWRFNTTDGAAKPRPGPQDVLVTRPEFDPAPHLLPVGAADWIAALAAGQSLGDALDSVCARHPEFDPTDTLALLLQTGALMSLTPKA
jgi:hypothetical protein